MNKARIIAAIGTALAWAAPALAGTVPPRPGSLSVEQAYMPYTVVILLTGAVLAAAFKGAKRSHMD